MNRRACVDNRIRTSTDCIVSQVPGDNVIDKYSHKDLLVLDGRRAMRSLGL